VKSDTCIGKSRTGLRHKHRRKELANIEQIHASLFYSVREETMDTDCLNNTDAIGLHLSARRAYTVYSFTG